MIEICENFEIEDLGIQEEWVYDIEVQDNHNFFGNNILVHNYVYYTIEPFMELYTTKNPGLPIDDYVNWADDFEKKVIQPIIQKTIDDFAFELNAYNKEAIGAEREIISDAAVFAAKKKYYARVRDSEGTRYPSDSPYIKVMGLEIIKSSTPPWCQKKLKQAIPTILDKSEEELRSWIQENKNDFIKADINEISQVGSASNLNYIIGEDKGIPIGSRAALCFNEYIKQNKLDDKYQPIQGGDKTKRIFLIEPNPFNSNIIAFNNEQFTNEIKDYIDYDTNFEKSFLKPLELMVESLNWDLTRETQSLDDW